MRILFLVLVLFSIGFGQVYDIPSTFDVGSMSLPPIATYPANPGFNAAPSAPNGFYELFNGPIQLQYAAYTYPTGCSFSLRYDAPLVQSSAGVSSVWHPNHGLTYVLMAFYAPGSYGMSSSPFGFIEDVGASAVILEWLIPSAAPAYWPPFCAPYRWNPTIGGCPFGGGNVFGDVFINAALPLASASLFHGVTLRTQSLWAVPDGLGSYLGFATRPSDILFN